MSVTLREVLELDPLRSAGPQVLSGHDRLDQPVRWVHVAEPPGAVSGIGSVSGPGGMVGWHTGA
jgi:hypothetical protein